MGKSMLLKDEKNRPGGYVIASGTQITWRAQTDAPAQMINYFADGTQYLCNLIGGKEQSIDNNAEMTGCCVVCREQVILSSDEKTRSAFLRQSTQKAHGEEQKSEKKEREEKPVSPHLCSQENTQKKAAEKTTALPQRRWPPPPCWEDACYLNGCWQETRTEEGMKDKTAEKAQRKDENSVLGFRNAAGSGECDA